MGEACECRPRKDVADGGDLGEDGEHLDWGDDDDEEIAGWEDFFYSFFTKMP